MDTAKCIGIGLALGLMFGVVLHSYLLGILIGLAIGGLICFVQRRRQSGGEFAGVIPGPREARSLESIFADL